jgi:hypothetical protein
MTSSTSISTNPRRSGGRRRNPQKPKPQKVRFVDTCPSNSTIAILKKPPPPLLAPPPTIHNSYYHPENRNGIFNNPYNNHSEHTAMPGDFYCYNVSTGDVDVDVVDAASEQGGGEEEDISKAFDVSGGLWSGF